MGGLHLLRRTASNKITAVFSGARTHVNNVISASDGVLVVLHHNDGIAQIAQILERGNKSIVITLMQADRGLVQNIEHAHKSCADLRCKANALRLATR